MCNKGFFKRFLPFFATFVIGLLIASFFVDISAPRLGRGRWMRQEIRDLRIENQQLREENQRLTEKLDFRLDSSSGSSDSDYGNGQVPNLDVPGLVPPPASQAAPRYHR